ncbi:MAG: hypothetical protein ACTH9H_11860 [Galactobacter sp.]
MKVGLRLRWIYEPDQDFTLFDLLDFVEHADTTTAIYRVLHPDFEWGLTEQLLAGALDFDVLKSWAEGGKKGQKPKPIPRPGVTDTETRAIKSKMTMSVTDMDEWLAKRRQSALRGRMVK